VLIRTDKNLVEPDEVAPLKNMGLTTKTENPMKPNQLVFLKNLGLTQKPKPNETHQAGLF